MDDEQTRTAQGAPRQSAPQQHPSPYAGYVPQEYRSDAHRSYDPYNGQPEPQWQPYDGGSSAYDDGRSPKRSMAGWLVPLVIVLLGVAAFGVVMMLLSRGKNHDATTANPAVAQSATAPAQPQQQSQQAQQTQSSSAGASYADFPGDTGTSCLGGTIDEPDIQIRNGSGSSCAYVSAIKSQVLSHLAQDGNASNFTISPYSVARAEYVTLTCSRADHLTRCTGGRNVDAYVKDHVQ